MRIRSWRKFLHGFAPQIFLPEYQRLVLLINLHGYGFQMKLKKKRVHWFTATACCTLIIQIAARCRGNALRLAHLVSMQCDGSWLTRQQTEWPLSLSKKKKKTCESAGGLERFWTEVRKWNLRSLGGGGIPIIWRRLKKVVLTRTSWSQIWSR